MKKVKKILLFIESDRISGLFNVRQDISKLRKYFKTDIKEDGGQVTIKVTVLQDLNIRKAYIKFILEGKISLVRDTSYKWEKLKIKHIFPSICNKIIKLKDKTLVTGTVPTSVWEVGGFGRNTIIDHLINPLITPVFHLQDNFRDFQKQFLIKKMRFLKVV